MKLQRLLAAGAVALAASLFAVPAANAEETATVSILHAIPGATVDVYANGNELLKDFKPGTLTDPQMLPAGKYDLKVVAAGAGADGAAVVEAKGVTVPAGANITVVANLTAEGAPALNAFVNDTSASKDGGRITVRHVAAAPAVDIRAGGKAVIKGLVNPKEAMMDIAAGTLNVDVVAAGTDTVVLGPADVKIDAGKNVIVYAWGSLTDKNLALAVQSVDLMKAGGSKPGMPSTGAEGPSSSAPIAAALFGALAIAGTAVVATRRRATSKA
ncbi:DUF4397 domain-containing protein [Tessaracoccus sp.]